MDSIDNPQMREFSFKIYEAGLCVLLGAVKELSKPPVLIKGYATVRNYPREHFRPFGDIDLAVSKVDYPKALELIRTFPELKRLNIDLHCELRHLDTLPFDRIIERSETIDLEGTLIRVPCPEDHLRILAVHWLNDGGERKDRLYDIYYAVQNRPADFDWDKCLGVVSPTRRKWVITTIGLAHKYLGLEIDDLPFADEALDIPKWITDTVEKEWATDVRLRSLHIVWRRPPMLWQQINKRIPPNPIQATIDTEGPFDDSPRIRYQIGSVAKRIGPSIKRVTSSIFRRRPSA